MESKEIPLKWKPFVDGEPYVLMPNNVLLVYRMPSFLATGAEKILCIAQGSPTYNKVSVPHTCTE